MDGHRIGRLHRLLRHRAKLTQAELADKAGVGRWKVIKLEAGELADLRLREVGSCLAAVDARLEVRATYRGAAGDRLLDELHARLEGSSVTVLQVYD